MLQSMEMPVEVCIHSVMLQYFPHVVHAFVQMGLLVRCLRAVHAHDLMMSDDELISLVVSHAGERPIQPPERVPVIQVVEIDPHGRVLRFIAVYSRHRCRVNMHEGSQLFSGLLVNNPSDIVAVGDDKPRVAKPMHLRGQIAHVVVVPEDRNEWKLSQVVSVVDVLEILLPKRVVHIRHSSHLVSLAVASVVVEVVPNVQHKQRIRHRSCLLVHRFGYIKLLLCPHAPVPQHEKAEVRTVRL
mmetsp:Transcript_10819/g.22570  ORF Transcript_10819/g.22570 Transcript_10819/m.22570 type:complete len:242 (-) Transcript_10819:179-904(-)